MNASSSPQLIEAPASDASYVRETLAYVDGYDAVLNGDYAFVAFKETARSGGEWCVRIASKGTTGVVFQPAMMRTSARTAGAQGKQYFLWGNGIEPSAGDPRQIEFRVHVANGAPSAIEIYLVLRKFDHTAEVPKSVKFAWPAA